MKKSTQEHVTKRHLSIHPDRAQVEETRTDFLDQGSVRLGDLPELWIPESLFFKEAEAVEVTMPLAAMSFEESLERLVGSKVRIERQEGLMEPTRYEGTLCAIQGAQSFLLDTEDGRRVALTGGVMLALDETKRPMKEPIVRLLQGAGERTFTYLTESLGWTPYWQGLLEGEVLTLRLRGRIENRSSLDLRADALTLYATAEESPRPVYGQRFLQSMSDAGEASQSAILCFPVDGGRTLYAHCAVQVPLSYTQTLPCTPIYRGRPEATEAPLHQVLCVETKDPLPAGSLYLFEQTDQGVRYLHQTQLTPAPAHSKAELSAGRSFTVTSGANRMVQEAPKDRREVHLDYWVKNEEDHAVCIELLEWAQGPLTVVSATHPVEVSEDGLTLTLTAGPKVRLSGSLIYVMPEAK
ncbi:hypothetical protein ABB02_00068 [Clostridiaceae bacterium JG1575]|nr:hypothetical protein ABB02_00068 [Clostridiaceae bacterium JG1575]